MRRTLLVFAAAAALAGCARQAPKTWPTAPPSSAWTPLPAGYLARGEAPDAEAILPPPPAPGTAAFKADRKAYLSARRLAGTARWDQAIRDADLTGREAFKAFSCAARIKIGPESTPVLARMIQRMAGDASPVYETAKDRYARRRPPVGDHRPICVAREDWIDTNGSYPSGHALTGWAWGLMLAQLVPERQNAILARAREIGDSRIVCGVHYPSDVEAGRLLAGALVGRLHDDAGFEADFAAARAELTASKTLGPPACPVS